MSPRRVIASPAFTARFGNLPWPKEFGPESFFVLNRPKNKFTADTPCCLKDRSGDVVACMAEAFDSTYVILFLIYEPGSVKNSHQMTA